MTYQIISIINANTDRVNLYENNHFIKKERLKLYDIIKNVKDFGPSRVASGHKQSRFFSTDISNEEYTDFNILEKVKKVRNAMTNGTYYFFDTETLGSPSSMNTSNFSDALNKANNDIFTITELAMYKQEYKNGKPVGGLQRVINFTSSRDAKTYHTYIQNMKNVERNSTVASTFNRLAGYSNVKNFTNGHVTSIDDYANIANLAIVKQGADVLPSKASFRHGTREYKYQAKIMFNQFMDIVHEDKAVLGSLNGDNFDIPILLDFFRDAFDGDDEILQKVILFEEGLKESHVDMQKLIRSTIREEVFQEQMHKREQLLNKAKSIASLKHKPKGWRERVESLKAEAYSIENNLTNEMLGYGVKEKGFVPTFGKGHQYIATYDTVKALETTSALMPQISKAADNLEKDIKKNKISATKEYYIAEKSVKADSSNSLFFSDKYNTPNVVNPTIMEPGHAYVVSQYSTNNIDSIAEEYKDKKLLKFQTADGTSDRTSYLLLNSDEEVREFLSSSKIKSLRINKENEIHIYETAKNAAEDRIRRELSNFQEVNSDKGFEHFEKYYEAYKEYSSKAQEPSKENFIKAIEEGSFLDKNGKLVSTSQNIPSIYTRAKGFENTAITERVDSMVMLFDDFKQNEGLYKEIVEQTNTIAGLREKFEKENPGERHASKLHSRKKTIAYSTIMDIVEQKILDSIDNDVALDESIKDNQKLQSLYNYKLQQERRIVAKRKSKRTGKKIEQGSIKFNEKRLTRIKKQAFKEYYGKGFDKGSDIVKNVIFNKKEVLSDIRSIDSVDILNSEGELSRINTSNKSELEKTLRRVVYRTKAEGNNQAVSERMRLSHADDIEKDLLDRGLITKSRYDSTTKSNTAQSKIAGLVEGILSQKELVIGPLQKAAMYRDYQTGVLSEKVDEFKMSSKQRKRANRYLKNQRVNKIYSNSKGFTVLGESAQSYISENLNERFFEEVYEKARKKTPSFMTSYIPSLQKGEIPSSPSIVSIQSKLREYGWSQANIDNFTKNVLLNKENKNFKYTNGKKIDGGLSYHFVEKDGQGFLIYTSSDREKLITDKIIKGTDIDDIRKHSAVFTVPIVEDLFGTKIVKSNKWHETAVTNSLVFEGGKFVIKDTIDEVVDKLGRNIKYTKKNMENRQYVKANTSMTSGIKSIYENKTLSAVVPRIKIDSDDKVTITKQLGVSRADQTLQSQMHIGDLTYALDTVLSSNNNLKSSLEKIIGTQETSKLQAKIQNNKKFNFSNGEMFEKLDLSTKAWFQDNISTIADTLLKDNNFTEQNESIIGVLEEIKLKGTSGFMTSESGDSSKGIYNFTSPDEYIAGATSSGATRPLQYQVMKAPNIFIDDMKLQAKIKLDTEGDELIEHLGIKMSHGYITKKTKDFTDRVLNGENMAMGYSANVKFMTPKEFLDSTMETSSLSDESDSMLRIINNLNSKGISAEPEQVRSAARRITQVTNLYEDSGLVTPILEAIMPEKTITTQDFNKDAKGVRFKVGQTIKDGMILDRDSKGKAIRYAGPSAKIVNIEDSKLIIQRNLKYNNFKAGMAGTEKVELFTPTFDGKEDAFILDSVIKHVAGDVDSNVNMIVNPAIKKHESFNVLASGYFNAITNSISSEENLDTANKVLSEKIKGQSFKIEYDEKFKRYRVVEGIRDHSVIANHIRGLQEVVKTLSQGDSSFSKSIVENIKSIEEKNISMIDIVTMQDNTIQNYQYEKNIGLGAGINHRAMSVRGENILTNTVKDMMNSRDNSKGRMVNILEPLLKEEINQILDTDLNKKGLQQALNINMTLKKIMNIKSNGINIKKIFLDDAVTVSGNISASELPEIFTITGGVNAYEIDLENIKLTNPLHDDIAEKIGDYPHYYKKHGLVGEVSRLIIPALDTNYANERYMLSETQKKASDLINAIYNFKKGNYEGTYDKAVSNLDFLYKEYIGSLRYELTDKNGILKKSLTTKALNSSRLKVGKIAAPIMDEDARYLDTRFSEISTPIVNNEVQYRGAIEANPDSIFKDRRMKYHIGKDILTKNIDESDEFRGFLKRKIGGNSVKITKIETLQHMLYEKIKDDNEAIANLAVDYATEVGFSGAEIMRDPAMKPTSYQSVRLYANKDIAQDVVNIDAVTASLINADSDGDEINLYKQFFKVNESGENTLRTVDDDVIKSLSQYADINKNFNMDIFRSISKEYSDKNEALKATQHHLDEYANFIENSRKEIFELANGEMNIDYYTGDTRYANTMARISKATIGQVSNPNYYLRSAAAAYFSDKYDLSSMKAYSNILKFTDFNEQSLIDVKSVKSIEDVENLAKLASSYRNSMDSLGDIHTKDIKSRNSNVASGVRSMYENILNSYKKIDGIELGYSEAMLEGNRGLAIDGAINRILKGREYRSQNSLTSTAEEVIADTLKVLQDKKANNVFYSSFIRQSDIQSSEAYGKKLTEFEKTARAIGYDTDSKSFVGMDGQKDVYKAATNNDIINSDVYIGERKIKSGDLLASPIGKPGIDESIYKVKKVKSKGTSASITLIDVLNKNKEVDIDNADFNELTNELKEFSLIQQKDIEKTKSSMKQNMKDAYFKRMTRDSLVLDKALEYYNNNSNSGTMKHEAIGSIISRFKSNMDNVKDSIHTADVLFDRGYIETVEERNSFLDNVAKRLKAEGEYRRVKKEEMLKISSIKAKGVTSNNIDKFLDKEVNKFGILNNTEELKNLYRYDLKAANKDISKSIYDSLKDASISDMSIDEISKMIESIRSSEFEKVRELDNTNRDRFEKIYMQNIRNEEFRKKYLHWDLEKVKKLIDEDESGKAMKIIGKTIVPFGEYAGMSLENLNIDQISNILNPKYMVGIKDTLPREALNHVQDTIMFMNQLTSKGVEIPTVPLAKYTVNNQNIHAQTIADIDDKIREKGNKRKAARESGAILNPIKSFFNKTKNKGIDFASKHKKGLLATAGIAAAGLVASSLMSGHEEPLNNSSAKISKKPNVNPNLVKAEVPKSSSQGEYENIPSTDTSFYQRQNVGMNINVQGKAPVGTSVDHASNTIAKMLGNTDINVNSNYNDNRRNIEDREVEEMMLIATL